MPFYHVLLTLSDSSHKSRCVFSDLSEEQLKKQFVKPYKKGKDVLCDKEVIRIASIKKVEIIRTAQTSEIELSTIQKRSRSEIDEFNSQSESVFLIGLGRGQDPEDIVEAGEDVTSKYIVGPPGHAVALTNPWIVAIVSGLIVGLIVMWVAWRFGFNQALTKQQPTPELQPPAATVPPPSGTNTAVQPVITNP